MEFSHSHIQNHIFLHSFASVFKWMGVSDFLSDQFWIESIQREHVKTVYFEILL